MTDIIEQIDAVIAEPVVAALCGWCDEPVPSSSPTIDFCDESHQELWFRNGRLSRAAHNAAVGEAQQARAARDAAEVFDAVRVRHDDDMVDAIRYGLSILQRGRRTVPRMPPTTIGIVGADDVPARGVRVRSITFNEVPRFVLHTSEQLAALQESMRAVTEGFAAMFEAFSTAVRPVVDSMRAASAFAQPRPVDPMAQALELRRTRNTGPAQRRRAPRRIDPTRTRR